MKKFTVAVLVNNKFGVLNRVTSMFRRRQFNITALTVSETEATAYSRITVCFDGEEDAAKKQLVDQLYKLPDVVSIRELDSDTSIQSELMLIKVRNTPELRGVLPTAAEAFGIVTVDYTKDAVTMQLAGDTRKMDSFINLMRDYTIMEICRTGVVALERGETVMNPHANIFM